MEKLERLLNLTALLLETSRPLQIGEIHDLMADAYPPDPDSFRRTFERDKRDLRDEGVPVEVVSLDPSDETVLGYRIDPAAYAQGDPGLAPEELAALRLAVAQLELDGLVGVDTFRKLGAVPEVGTPPAPVGDLHVSDHLAELVRATRERRVVTFGYQGEDRVLEPHRVDHRAGRWYVTGRDVARDARRTFRLDRMSAAPRSGDAGAFAAPGAVPGIRFEPWRFGDEPERTAVLSVDADHVAVARARLGGTGTWSDEPDGRARVTLQVTDTEAFRTLVLEFLDHVEVVAPPELRRAVVEWVESVL